MFTLFLLFSKLHILYFAQVTISPPAGGVLVQAWSRSALASDTTIRLLGSSITAAPPPSDDTPHTIQPGTLKVANILRDNCRQASQLHMQGPCSFKCLFTVVLNNVFREISMTPLHSRLYIYRVKQSIAGFTNNYTIIMASLWILSRPINQR